MSYTVEQIEEITSTILTSLNENNKNIVDVIEIANRIGFDVYQANFDGDISGMVKNSQSERSIYINSDDIPTRQRFTIAHEIGHIILHHDNLEEDFNVVDYRSKSFSPRESEADAFAAALLMPADKTRQVWKKLDDVDDFAKEFKVSRMAASIRLSNLGLI